MLDISIYHVFISVTLVTACRSTLSRYTLYT